MEEGEPEEELAPLVRLGLALVEALLGDHLVGATGKGLGFRVRAKVRVGAWIG